MLMEATDKHTSEKLDDAHALFNTTPAIAKAKPIVDFSANAPPPPPSVGTAIPLSIEMHAVVLSLSFEMRAVVLSRSLKCAPLSCPVL